MHARRCFSDCFPNSPFCFVRVASRLMALFLRHFVTCRQKFGCAPDGLETLSSYTYQCHCPQNCFRRLPTCSAMSQACQALPAREALWVFSSKATLQRSCKGQDL